MRHNPHRDSLCEEGYNLQHMKPRVLRKAYRQVIELGKTLGKWIIKGLDLTGRFPDVWS